MKYYVLDENNNKVEAYDKEGVLAILNQAIADGTLENITKDAAFISKIKCCVGGDIASMAFITQAKYNELEKAGTLIPNCYYFIIDDTTAEDINIVIENLNNEVSSIKERLNKLGFKEGTFAYTGGGAVNENVIKKQGKYVIASLSVMQSTEAAGVVSLAQDFRPKEKTKLTTVEFDINTGINFGGYVYLNVDGILYSNEECTTKYQHQWYTITNAGWETN
jgi:hypothetical protein